MSIATQMNQTVTNPLPMSLLPTDVRRDTSTMIEFESLQDFASMTFSGTRFDRVDIPTNATMRRSNIEVGGALSGMQLPVFLEVVPRTIPRGSSSIVVEAARSYAGSLGLLFTAGVQGRTTLQSFTEFWMPLPQTEEEWWDNAQPSSSETSLPRTTTSLPDDEPVLSFADLDFSTSEDMQEEGFPFNVPDDLTAAEGRELERILDHGGPNWIRDLRDRLAR